MHQTATGKTRLKTIEVSWQNNISFERKKLAENGMGV